MLIQEYESEHRNSSFEMYRHNEISRKKKLKKFDEEVGKEKFFGSEHLRERLKVN